MKTLQKNRATDFEKNLKFRDAVQIDMFGLDQTFTLEGNQLLLVATFLLDALNPSQYSAVSSNLKHF